MNRHRYTAGVLSGVIMGLGQLYNRQYVKGIILIIIKAAAIIFLAPTLPRAFWGIWTLGEKLHGFKVVNKISVRVEGDNSITLLINGLLIMFVLAIFIVIWIMNIRDAYRTGSIRDNGETPATFEKTVSYLLDRKFPHMLMIVPAMGVLFLTVMPIVFMVLLSFTNYSSPHHIPPGKLVDWVGFQTFIDLLTKKTWSGTFYGVFLWTVVWAVLATLTCYFGGLLVALLIEQKGVRFKKLWRTIFILPYAIPQLISLLVMRNLFNGQFGPINTYLTTFGFGKVPWLTDPFMAKVTAILVNMWVGIPVSMVLLLGVLTAIPKDLYEAADVDGASAFQKFKIVTLPFVMFATAPILITQFAGNFNNFNLIFLLTGGLPANGDYLYAGSTDLLVTWLFKLTLTNSQYNMASAIGIIIFIVIATFSIYNYRRTKSFKEEDMIQ
ncbi:carbohydrate ABC transporter permease [Paenibacillus sp. NEAU-GSW1]|uniref:carbohydrate ABC transporter permease n=1 Tax=Paenibacillus sp. NEAU-GSW1 TaxID=2682486 RepID=UPI0012E31C17|nr:sugar ABC transporter permease [Paenibacillus sp. NEAU-GSW1]MUT64550.1 ABC transporter permease subunit [Paenibacillus sp. NEAU-GSW1]